ncbi:sensor histidine kinase [Leucobacter aridicollis]|uniref:histidine kinase n=1 Tax=Leucobacter aridicollis TaxID=283878 RepID=A0A852RG05_9MICO|nr:HAMP domain-containing sensor histidine kinase [Leucobacter aridicollis]NYD27800.1 signal transduction histidine kinase [Leucobacter aridicollis]
MTDHSAPTAILPTTPLPTAPPAAGAAGAPELGPQASTDMPPAGGRPDRRRSAAPRPLQTRALPARWRITVWIVLSTLFTLCAIALIGRSLTLASVEVEANAQITQEAEEFTRFVAEGVDPETTKPFATPARLLEVYLSRQSVSDSELIIGLADRAPVGSLSGVDGWAPDRSPAPQLLETLTAPAKNSGALTTADGEPVRWGRVDFVVGEQSGSLLVAQFTAADRAAVDRAVGTLAWVAAAGLLLCSGVAWLVAGQILAPVREVYRVARDITEHDLTARVPVDGNDDIAQVAATFNEMLDRLEEAHRAQQQFVDDAGHELRTPITVVRGHLELLSEDPDERRATLRLVTDELARMSRIVSDLLVLARAQQHDFVRFAPCDVAALTLDIEAKAQALGERRWQLMEVAEGDAIIDAQRVTQAVLQLAANAVQVTDAGDRIRIGSRFEGDGAERRLRVWVADEGPGVSDEAATRIFDRFVHGGHVAVRSDTAGSSPRHGSGLGLAIVRAITDGHGGSAWLESTLGEGATFGLDLPAPQYAETKES